MGLRDQVKQLEQVMNHLPSGKQDFARSLVGQWRQKGRLSQPQQLWVDKLIEAAAEAQKTKESVVTPTGTDLGVDLKGLHTLFGTAKSNDIAKPRITTATSRMEKVVLSPAPESSANVGHIYIRVGGEYYGKVSPEGKLFTPSFVQPCEEVNQLIHDIAADPSKAGKVQGQRVKWCIFCSRELTTLESLYAGYGPICADKWGLEWGETGREPKPSKEKEVEDDRFSQAAADLFAAGGLSLPNLNSDSRGAVESDD